MKPWLAAALQFDLAPANPALNVDRALALADALPTRPDLVLLPELFTTGYCLDRAAELAPEGPRSLVRLADWARDRRCAVSGSLLHPWSGGVANAAFLIDCDGASHPLYAKAHLFRPMDEHLHLVVGRELRLWDSSVGRLGIAVCYDLRFPAMIRRLALAGAATLLVPAEWPRPRTSHWELLLRARAVENGLFVLGANRIGAQAGQVFEGASQLVDPWGEVLAHAGSSAGDAAAVVDPERAVEARRRIPVLEDEVEGVDR